MLDAVPKEYYASVEEVQDEAFIGNPQVASEYGDAPPGDEFWNPVDVDEPHAGSSAGNNDFFANRTGCAAY